MRNPTYPMDLHEGGTCPPSGGYDTSENSWEQKFMRQIFAPKDKSKEPGI